MVAGDFMLLGAIVTIVVVMLTMAELGARYEKKQGVAPSVPAPALLVAASVAPAPQATPATAARGCHAARRHRRPRSPPPLLRDKRRQGDH